MNGWGVQQTSVGLYRGMFVNGHRTGQVVDVDVDISGV